MLAGAVYALEGLLVEQTDEVVLFGDLLHDFHCQLVVVGCDVGGREDRSKLMLCRCDLVVLCLCENAELPELLVEILHVSRDSRFDRAEVVILKLLTFGSHCAEQRSAAELQILSLLVQILVNQKVFLFGADGSRDALYVGFAEKMKHLHSLCAQTLHGTEQRSLFVEHLSGVGAECRRDI